ncbi:zinc finger protein 106 [Xenentodon cancila]
MGYNKFSGSNTSRQLKGDGFQTDGLSKTHKCQGGATDRPNQMTLPPVSQNRYYSMQSNSGPDRDFTSDNLPENGAIVFDHDHGETTASFRPEGSSCSCCPAPANKSDDTAPVQELDVAAMLKQIRRVLGVREPCRADREARKQNSEVSVRAVDRSATQQAEAGQPAGTSTRIHVTSSPAVPPPQVTAPAPRTDPSSIDSATSNHTTVKRRRRRREQCRENSLAAERLSNSSENDYQGCSEGSTSLSRCAATYSEPNLSKPHKVRIAHRPQVVQEQKEVGCKPTLGNLPNLSGARSNLSWRKMYDDMKRKDVRGAPRFGIMLANHETDHERSTRDDDLPLSEGFHWESLPGGVSGTDLTLPPPSHESHPDTQPVSRLEEPLEQPRAAQSPRSSQTVTGATVKEELNVEDESGALRNSVCANKRKNTTVTDDGEASEKSGIEKKKRKSNKDQEQLDQLLAVSVREDELSHSLQDLDKCLVQARSALQVAYTEVQRLMLLRQQFTNEVDSLRTKRIEILQLMQEGYSGASKAAERASTSSAGAAATIPSPSLPSSSAFSSSLSQQSPAASPLSHISQPHPTPQTLAGVPLKQEICSLAPAGQTSVFSRTSPCISEVSQVLVNPPAPLFPSNLLPPLLLRPSHLGAPTDAQKPLAESSTFVNSSSPVTSARQKEEETRERLKSSTKAMVLTKEAPCAQSESGTKTGRHKKMGNVKGNGSSEDKSVQRKATEVDNEGNESDNSVEMVSFSNQEVIDVDKSDCEESPETDAPVQPEAPQKSVGVDFSSPSTQSETKTESKIQPLTVQTKDANTPAVKDDTISESMEDKELSLGSFLSHAGSVHGLQVHNGLLYTCSGDNTARAYSLESRECQAVFEGHTNKVNCLLVSSLPNMPTRLYTGSSDQTIRCYSIKSKKCLEQLSLPDRVLCLHVAWNTLYAGLASGSVTSFDLKTVKELDVFECHGPRGVSCLGTAQEGARRLLLVGSYDSTISIRDAKSGLLLRSLQGHTKTVLCMKVVNDLVFSGSSDTSVHAHNIHTGELIRIYKGHSHAVTSIAILGKVMLTACLDKLVRVYELQSHDRLQVYGGHSDMVMCMAVHKSVIYTGCYDGSIQAVKLNLIQNHRCWWQSCPLVFGVPEHLIQHLVNDHSNPNLQTVKCRWKGCNTFFATTQSVKQASYYI